MYNTIKANLLTARKDSNKKSVTILSTLLGEIEKPFLAEVKAGSAIPDEAVTKVIVKFIKGLEESINALEAREMPTFDQVHEKTLLEEYLPVKLTGSELLTYIGLAVSHAQASSMKDMGKVMQELKKLSVLKSFIYDGKEASTVIKEVLCQ